MDRETLDGWCERGIQALILAILILGPLAFGAVDPVPFVAIEGLTVGALLLWAARFWINPRLRLLWPPACWAVLAFTGYTIVRYFTSEIEYVARGELIHVLVYASLFFSILNNAHRQDATQVIVCALVCLAMAISGYALYQYLSGTTRVWHLYNSYPHRGTGTYINPNHLGGFLELVLPLALGFTLVSRFKAVPRILLGYAALVILAGIAVANSRGSWLSTAGTVSFLNLRLRALSPDRDHQRHLYNSYPHRGTGTYINPNHLGGFLEMLLPLALAFTLVSRFKAVPRILLGYAALVILAGIAVTNSRGSWLSTGGTVVLFFALMALNRVHRLPALALLILIVGGCVLLLPRSRMIHNRAQVVVNGKLDDDKRFDLWRPAISIWRENIWWGGGPAHYNERFRAYRPRGVQAQPDHAHNDYLDALADYGIAGASIIAAALALVFAGAVATWRKVRPAARDIGRKVGSNKYAFVFGASLGLLAIACSIRSSILTCTSQPMPSWR